MSDENQRKKFSMADVRKTYPKAGLRWAPEEDEELKKAYAKHQKDGGDFEVFISNLSKQFGRAVGGMKGRLAKYFPDIPGWDYGRDEFRKEELNKKAENLIGVERDDFLKQEYAKYLESRNETYLSFVKRLAAALGGGVEAGLIGHRLGQLVGDIEKYHRDDVSPSSFRGEGAPPRRTEIPMTTFS